ncbi:SRPBCC family protein [Arthrobacter sp. TMS1-12-1]
MTGLFSHPPAASGVPDERPDLRFSVSVPAPADHAWAGFTQHLHLWWPVGELSRWGEGSFFDLEDNALVETSAEEDENVWGEVTDSHPGEWLELAWRHLGSASTTGVRIEVSAGGEPDLSGAVVGSEDVAAEQRSGALLTLVHSGWTAGEAQHVYEFYRGFWPDALARYCRFMGGS